jgi:hypothetical protein
MPADQLVFTSSKLPLKEWGSGMLLAWRLGEESEMLFFSLSISAFSPSISTVSFPSSVWRWGCRRFLTFFFFSFVAPSRYSLDYNNIIVINDRHRHHTVHKEDEWSWVEWRDANAEDRPEDLFGQHCSRHIRSVVSIFYADENHC